MNLMAKLEDSFPRRILSVPPIRVIVFTRLVLTIFAIAAIALDLPQFTRSATHTYIIAFIYLAFAFVSLYIVMQGPPSTREQIFAHTVDIVCICLLLYLNHGPDSPFLLFFTFLIVSATLRWDWRGAIITTASLVLIFFLATQIESHGLTNRHFELSLSQTILRPANLLVAGIMLGYVGALQERSRHRLAQLVAWPGPEHKQDISVPIISALEHAAEILCVERVLILWEQPDEPFRDVVHWSKQGIQYRRERSDRFGTIVADPVAGKSFLCHPWVQGAGADELINEDLRQTFSIQNALSAPFHLPVCSGRIFLIDPIDESSPDDLLLAELIATRLGVDLEHYLLRSEREMAVALNERARLARDLHDGVLQGLAAANIHLTVSLNKAGGEILDHLARVRQILTAEHQRIRAFVEMTRLGKSVPSSPTDLGHQIRTLLSELSGQWDCTVEVTTDPPDLQTVEHIAHNIRFLLTEALSNAVRHGKASHIEISIRAEHDHLKLGIKDNGRGFPGLDGRYSDEELKIHNLGPLSLRSRVMELGGALSLVASPSGTEINIEIPL
jgi:signal transduction histidine kinase